MKALLLCGGTGTRLKPLTNYINKHEIQIAGKTLAEHALCSIITAGISEIIITHNGGFADSKLLNDLTVKYKNVAEIKVVETVTQGVAGEIIQTSKYLKGDNFIVIFGDTFFEDSYQFQNMISNYQTLKYDGMITLGKAVNPARHCTPIFEGDKVVKVIEKYKEYTHNWVVTTWDIFPEWLLDELKNLKKSARGEYEIADMRNLVIEKGNMGYFKINGWWIDAGIESDLFMLNSKILERDLNSQNYISTGSKIANSQITSSPVNGNYDISNSKLSNCILMGSGQVIGQDLNEKVVYQGEVITFTGGKS